jgi:hypothetical protein
VHAVSERRWTIALDAATLLSPPRRIELRLPVPKLADAAAKYQAYQDMDLLDLAEPVTVVGPTAGEIEARSPAATAGWGLYVAVASGAVIVLLLVAGVVWALRGHGPRPLRARDVFHLPARVDGFVVVQLLRSLGTSSLVRLSPSQRADMQEEIQRIQKACFGGNGSSLSADELRAVARKWLKIAC